MSADGADDNQNFRFSGHIGGLARNDRQLIRIANGRYSVPGSPLFGRSTGRFDDRERPLLGGATVRFGWKQSPAPVADCFAARPSAAGTTAVVRRHPTAVPLADGRHARTTAPA